MGKKRIVDVSADNETLPSQNRRNIPMTDVKRVPPQDLTINHINQEYFDTESEQHLQDLREDIRRRGVIVPLIAKRDGTLLAGHNRLMVARELNLKLVPVQYVQEELSGEAEREFIIKDNLLRRQLSPEKRIMLYKKAYPDFETTFLDSERPNVGGRTKNGQTNRLTIARIAEETGQKEETVKKHIQGYRKKRGEALPPFQNNNEKINSFKKLPASKRKEMQTNDETTSKSEIMRTAHKLVNELEQALEQATKEEREAIIELFRRVL
jgi:hypothetical protein